MLAADISATPFFSCQLISLPFFPPIMQNGTREKHSAASAPRAAVLCHAMRGVAARSRRRRRLMAMLARLSLFFHFRLRRQRHVRPPLFIATMPLMAAEAQCGAID